MTERERDRRRDDPRLDRIMPVAVELPLVMAAVERDDFIDPLSPEFPSSARDDATVGSHTMRDCDR